MKKYKLVLGIVLIIIGAGIIWFGLSMGDQEAETTTIESQNNETVETAEVSMQNLQPSSGSLQAPDGLVCSNFDQSGELVDVSGGQGNGSAGTCFTENNEFYMYASISNVPAAQDGYFYEGWLVERSSGNFISTGQVIEDEKSEGLEIVSLYDTFLTDEKDFSSYNFYVLTLEPDDGDPAPAEHIVEGELNKVATEG